MPKIAISYRRSDSSAITGRIFDRLIAHYGEESVFMDIDSIPIGSDFRNHIRETLARTDVLITVIGVKWTGHEVAGAAEAARIHEPTDPVRVEVLTAIERGTAIIPVLVDGARMPDSAVLPAEFGNFAFLNAAEVHSGRDFRHHVDRLIGAIDLATGNATSVYATRLRSGKTAAAGGAASTYRLWLTDSLRFLLVPLVLLLVAHHLIVNAFDLKIVWLQVASTVVPFVFGFALFWLTGRGAGPAVALAVVLGIAAVVGMTVSEGLNAGDPIMPHTRVEWRESVQYAVAIALSFIVGHMVARAARAMLGKRFVKR